MACGRNRGSNGEKAPVDLRADRQYRLRLTYDLTAKPVASEMRLSQPDRVVRLAPLAGKKVHKTVKFTRRPIALA
jgi:hypothetical protein